AAQGGVRSAMAKKKSRAAAVVLPTREELLALPHWARVAFCARLARRLLPLVAGCWETKVTVDYLHDPRHLKGTRKCVWHAARAAATAGVVYERALYDARDAAGVAGDQAEYAARLARRRAGSRQYAASVAANAAHLAGSAAFSLSKPDWVCEYGQA